MSQKEAQRLALEASGFKNYNVDLEAQDLSPRSQRKAKRNSQELERQNQPSYQTSQGQQPQYENPPQQPQYQHIEDGSPSPRTLRSQAKHPPQDFGRPEASNLEQPRDFEQSESGDGPPKPYKSIRERRKSQEFEQVMTSRRPSLVARARRDSISSNPSLDIAGTSHMGQPSSQQFIDSIGNTQQSVQGPQSLPEQSAGVQNTQPLYYQSAVYREQHGNQNTQPLDNQSVGNHGADTTHPSPRSGPSSSNLVPPSQVQQGNIPVNDQRLPQSLVQRHDNQESTSVINQGSHRTDVTQTQDQALQQQGNWESPMPQQEPNQRDDRTMSAKGKQKEQPSSGHQLEMNKGNSSGSYSELTPPQVPPQQPPNPYQNQPQYQQNTSQYVPQPNPQQSQQVPRIGPQQSQQVPLPYHWSQAQYQQNPSQDIPQINPQQLQQVPPITSQRHRSYGIPENNTNGSRLREGSSPLPDQQASERDSATEPIQVQSENSNGRVLTPETRNQEQRHGISNLTSQSSGTVLSSHPLQRQASNTLPIVKVQPAQGHAIIPQSRVPFDVDALSVINETGSQSGSNRESSMAEEIPRENIPQSNYRQPSAEAEDAASQSSLDRMEWKYKSPSPSAQSYQENSHASQSNSNQSQNALQPAHQPNQLPRSPQIQQIQNQFPQTPPGQQQMHQLPQNQPHPPLPQNPQSQSLAQQDQPDRQTSQPFQRQHQLPQHQILQIHRPRNTDMQQTPQTQSSAQQDQQGQQSYQTSRGQQPHEQIYQPSQGQQTQSQSQLYQGQQPPQQIHRQSQALQPQSQSQPQALVHRGQQPQSQSQPDSLVGQGQQPQNQSQASLQQGQQVLQPQMQSQPQYLIGQGQPLQNQSQASLQQGQQVLQPQLQSQSQVLEGQIQQPQSQFAQLQSQPQALVQQNQPLSQTVQSQQPQYQNQPQQPQYQHSGYQGQSYIQSQPQYQGQSQAYAPQGQHPSRQPAQINPQQFGNLQPQFSTQHPVDPYLPAPWPTQFPSNTGISQFPESQFGVRLPPPPTDQNGDGIVPPFIDHENCVWDQDRTTGEGCQKTIVAIRKVGAGYQLIAKSHGRNPDYPHVYIFEALRGAKHREFVHRWATKFTNAGHEPPWLVTTDAKETATLPFAYINLLGVITAEQPKLNENYDERGQLNGHNLPKHHHKHIIAEWNMPGRDKYEARVFSYDAMQKVHGFKLAALVEDYLQKSGQWRHMPSNPRANPAETVRRYAGQVQFPHGMPSFTSQSHWQYPAYTGQPQIYQPQIYQPQIYQPPMQQPPIQQSQIYQPQMYQPQTQQLPLQQAPIQQPQIQQPQIQNQPQIQQPHIQQPQIQQPQIQQPQIQQPQIHQSQTQQPQPQQPQVQQSQIQQPYIPQPQIQQPQVHQPQTQQPHTQQPYNPQPQIQQPQAPGTSVATQAPSTQYMNGQASSLPVPTSGYILPNQNLYQPPSWQPSSGSYRDMGLGYSMVHVPKP